MYKGAQNFMVSQLLRLRNNLKRFISIYVVKINNAGKKLFKEFYYGTNLPSRIIYDGNGGGYDY